MSLYGEEMRRVSVSVSVSDIEFSEEEISSFWFCFCCCCHLIWRDAAAWNFNSSKSDVTSWCGRRSLMTIPVAALSTFGSSSGPNLPAVPGVGVAIPGAILLSCEKKVKP